MFLNCLLLAISSSVDSLGIGITYGIKNTRITSFAKVILFLISFVVSNLSIWLGNILKLILPDFITVYIGAIVLIVMGFFMCFQSLSGKNKNKEKSCLFNKTSNKNLDFEKKKKIYSFFIKFLGITIKIIKNPVSSDFDGSNSIDAKEALFLGFALSLDSFCIGIGFSVMSISSILFPFFISCFQFFFINLGNLLGRKLYKFSKIPDNVWSVISGVLLIIIGVAKFL